jgi:hypothetical protein
MKKWDSGVQITNKEVEVNERVEKGKCLFFREEGKEMYLLLLCKEAEDGQRSRRINEAAAFRKLFSRDKNPELRHLG